MWLKLHFLPPQTSQSQTYPLASALNSLLRQSSKQSPCIFLDGKSKGLAKEDPWVGLVASCRLRLRGRAEESSSRQYGVDRQDQTLSGL